MKGSHQKQNQEKQGKKQTKKVSSGESSLQEEDQQSQENLQQLSCESGSDQLSEESSPVEAAIKSMKFRTNRGSRMKQLLKGNINKDKFWQKHAPIFGGNLNEKEQQDEEDYQQSSSGRDQFDSDFNDTDSYPGKRGRKKGTKLKKRKVEGRGRGRPRKIKEQKSESQGQGQQKPRRGRKQQKKKQEIEKRYKIIYKKVEEKKDDIFVIMKATKVVKRGRRPKNLQKDSKIEIQKENSE